MVVIDEDALISPDTKKRILGSFHFYADMAKRRRLGKVFFPLLFVVSFLFMAFFLAIGANQLAGGTLLGIIFAAIYIWWGSFYANKDLSDAKDIPLPCPLCHEKISLTNSWLCGNCNHEHNSEGDASPAIPFVGCIHFDCSQPEQTAFQCPHCHHHIVLDKSRYIGERSYEHPHRYVARYSSDTSAAIPHRPTRSATPSAFDDEGSVFDD